MTDSFDSLPVLVIEDSTDDLELLRHALDRAGVHNPQILASTAAEAIQHLEAAAAFENHECPFPAVLFLDLTVPAVGGISVLEWLHEHAPRRTCVVLHTGTEDDDLLRRARDLGAHFHLPKGARPEAIREVFHRAREGWSRGLVLRD